MHPAGRAVCFSTSRSPVDIGVSGFDLVIWILSRDSEDSLTTFQRNCAVLIVHHSRPFGAGMFSGAYRLSEGGATLGQAHWIFLMIAAISAWEIGGREGSVL